MTQARITSKGQVTIPLEVRRRLGLQAGSKIDFVWRADGRVEVEVVRTSVASLAGILRRDEDVSLSVEAMDEAVREEAASRSIGPDATTAE